MSLSPVPQHRPAAILFDRDGTLIENVPYNGDPSTVVLRPGAVEALALLRAQGLGVGVVTNQSGIGRGIVTAEQVHSVNRRVESLLGKLGPWAICPHPPAAGCRCRKPGPGLVEHAAAALGVPVARCVVIGDQPTDVEAAWAAGARGVLVPSPDTPQAATQDGSAWPLAADLYAAVRDLVALPEA